MSRPTSVTVSSVASSAPIVIDHNEAGFGVGMGLVITGTGTYKIQHTFDNVMDAAVTPTWFDHPVVTGKTASIDGNYAFPVRAVRLTATAYTSGAGTLTVVQGRN